MAYSLARERPIAAAWPVYLFGLLLRPITRASKARRQRLTLATLLELDDYRLWDMGISRGDLNQAIRADGFDIDAIRDQRRSLDVWPPR